MSKYLQPSSYLRWTLELREFWRARRSSRGFVAFGDRDGMHYIALPERIWATKSHEWWTLLAVLLRRLRPESILELGSGRSTVYLSEYACKEGKHLVSVDENPSWNAVNRLFACLGGLTDDFVYYVPVTEDGYYDIDRLKSLVRHPPDLLYLDGPIRDRSGLLHNEFTANLCVTADVIIVDDIQRAHVFDQMQTLRTMGMQRTATVVGYDIPKRRQYLAILLREDLHPVLDELMDVLRVTPEMDYTREKCVQE